MKERREEKEDEDCDDGISRNAGKNTFKARYQWQMI